MEVSSRRLDSDASEGGRAKRFKREGQGEGCCWQNDIPEHLLLLVFETMQFREDGVELVWFGESWEGVCWSGVEIIELCLGCVQLKVAERVCRRWRRAAQGTLLMDTAATRLPRWLWN